MTMMNMSIDSMFSEISTMIGSINDDGNIITNSKINRDTMSLTVSMLDDYSEKSILILVAHDTEKGSFAVFVTNGDDGGHKILYRNISKNPILGLKKYLPNILASTKNMLYSKNKITATA